MNNQALTSDLVTVALERVEGTPFERFVNAFYPAISGSSYVPLGGLHDGGADGFFDSGLSEVRGKQGAFLQASIQEDHRAKIRGTVRRLIEFGRNPTHLTYVTSRDLIEPDIKSSRAEAFVEPPGEGVVVRSGIRKKDSDGHHQK